MIYDEKCRVSLIQLFKIKVPKGPKYTRSQQCDTQKCTLNNYNLFICRKQVTVLSVKICDRRQLTCTFYKHKAHVAHPEGLADDVAGHTLDKHRQSKAGAVCSTSHQNRTVSLELNVTWGHVSVERLAFHISVIAVLGSNCHSEKKGVFLGLSIQVVQ